MKSPATRLIPIEMEIGRKPASEGAQAFEQALPIGSARDYELAHTGGVDLDIVALLQLSASTTVGAKLKAEWTRLRAIRTSALVELEFAVFRS